MINAFHELLVYDARQLFYINTHASFPWVVFDIFKPSCCPECDSSMSPSLSLLSCFCGDKGLAPFEVKLEVKVEAKWDIHSLAELPALQKLSNESRFPRNHNISIFTANERS
jgi:hypothetical protein